MKVRFRFMDKWVVYEEKGKWMTWGTLYENCGTEFPDRSLLFRTIPDDDRQTARYFDARIREFAPSLENAEVVFGDYAGRFRLRSEIHTVEGETHQEIRQQLWERIFAAPEPEAVEPMPVWEEYTVHSAYQVMRETPTEAEET